MSELQVGQINSTDGSTAITTGDDGYVSFAKTQIGGRRNLIINGAMQVAQRGTSAANNSSDGVFVCDRWRQFHNGTGLVYDIEQSTDAPDGFATSYKATCDTAGSGTDYYQAIIQRIEAQNVQHLKYGTASAETSTLSFWVKSSETGDFTLLAFCQDGNRASNYAVTINSANTWEYKTVTITGDTSGTINNDNGRGIDLWFVFSAGSDWTSGTFTGWESYVSSKFAGHNTIDTNTAGKTFQITGVQLEVGTVATPFEHRSYGEELAACMRYCYVFGTGTTNNAALGTGFAYQTTWAFASIHFPVEMRSTPSLSNVGGSWEWSDWHVSGIATGALSFGDGTRQGGKVFSAGTASGLTDYRDYFLQRAGGSPTLTFDAEL